MRHSLKPRAAADIRSLYAQGVEMFGVEQAERYAAGLDRAFEFLTNNPRAVRLRSELTPPLRAYPYGSHLIVYDLGPDDRVIVVRVRHHRENWTANPA